MSRWRFVICCLALAGCFTVEAVEPQGGFDEVAQDSSSKAYLLYILPSPCPRLYVEIDAVEGCVPSDATIKKVRDFLATYCHKPDGIEIARGPVIPRKAARGLEPGALAGKYISGPPTNSAGPPCAFMGLLFYNGELCDESAVAETGHLAGRLRAHNQARIRNPRTMIEPYPVIYMNMHYGPDAARDEILLHEAGHMLGLVSRTNYATNHHCLDPNCLMYKNLAVTLSIHRIPLALLGKSAYIVPQKRFCQRCVDELVQESKQSSPANLHFVGPVLVRDESDYHVLSFPNRVKVIAGKVTEQDCREFAAAARAEPALAGEDPFEVEWSVKKEMRPKETEIALRCQADRLADVRWIAFRGGIQPGIQRFYAQNQFTNAVDVLTQCVHADPENDWSYNDLAWFKATCQDASVRDGKEAVADATKACELSNWTNADWIDTLAAACAESGDFKSAVKFEKKALRTGELPKSDRKDMRERCSLYKQSRPYRESP